MIGLTHPQRAALDAIDAIAFDAPGRQTWALLADIAARTDQTTQGAAMTLASLVRKGAVEQIKSPARYRRADR